MLPVDLPAFQGGRCHREDELGLLFSNNYTVLIVPRFIAWAAFSEQRGAMAVVAGNSHLLPSPLRRAARPPAVGQAGGETKFRGREGISRPGFRTYA